MAMYIFEVTCVYTAPRPWPELKSCKACRIPTNSGSQGLAAGMPKTSTRGSG